MNPENLPIAGILNDEVGAISKMLKLVEKNHSSNLAVGINTTYTCASNERHEVTSKRVLTLFVEALSKRLEEIEEEVKNL